MDGYDVVVEGDSHGDFGAVRPPVQQWADAGATWWVESWWDLPDSPEGRAETRRRLALGPAPVTRAPDAVLRVATPADAAALVELRAVMFEGMGTPPAAIADPGWRRAAHDWFTDAGGRPRGRASWSREVGGQVVSCAVGEVTALIPGPNTVTGSVGLISNVATRPATAGGASPRRAPTTCCAGSSSRPTCGGSTCSPPRPGRAIYTGRGFTVRGFEAMVPAGRPLTRAGTGHGSSRAENTPPPSREAACSLLSTGPTVRCRCRRPA